MKHLENKVEYRKVQEFVRDYTIGISLPKNYVVNLGIGKGDFVKIYQELNRIIIEKA